MNKTIGLRKLGGGGGGGGGWVGGSPPRLRQLLLSFFNFGVVIQFVFNELINTIQF